MIERANVWELIVEWDLDDLARAVGVSKAHLLQCIHGKTDPRLRTLRAFARAIGRDLETVAGAFERSQENHRRRIAAGVIASPAIDRA